MHMNFRRRSLLQATAAASLTSLPLCALSASTTQRHFQPSLSDWRTFELTTRVEILDVKGLTKLWLPIPDLDTDYQRTLTHNWVGNASVVKVVADPKQDVRMAYAEFDNVTETPVLTFTSRFQTRNRVTDWRQPLGFSSEDASTLQKSLKATELLPLDGIVRQTALTVTQGAKSDVDKVHAIYNWVVANAHREPKTRGCGVGDIKSMLETGDLSGKCADLNALFVGLCRACGVPARDVYGLRLAPSVFPYKELGANSANLKGAQHCRAEVWLSKFGWVPMDPADVLKVMRQETTEWIKDPTHDLIAPVMTGLFGSWEGNWVGWNRAHDVRLPGSQSRLPIGFLMYPNGENTSGRFDELSPDTFKYSISATEITA
jgi:transglutaminase-like putative cysteine protease